MLRFLLLSLVIALPSRLNASTNAFYYDENGKVVMSDCFKVISDKEKYKECPNDFHLKSCSLPDNILVKDYPVRQEKMVLVTLKYLDDRPNTLASYGHQVCRRSNINLGCIAGDCYARPSGGKYGFFPGETNRLRIGEKVWTWTGSPPASQGQEKWTHVVDGVVASGELSLWPNQGFETFSQKLIIPEGLKDRIYSQSLEKP